MVPQSGRCRLLGSGFFSFGRLIPEGQVDEGQERGSTIAPVDPISMGEKDSPIKQQHLRHNHAGFNVIHRLVSSLVLNEEELRGMVWRSKSQSSGHPFGVVSSGLCSTGTYTWLVKFLRTWDSLLAKEDFCNCDFLIPHLSEAGTLLSHEPLDYASTQKVFRHMLRTPWKTFKEGHPLDTLTMNYTLHSLKATLLSFGPQLGHLVASDDRLQQGHHADPRKSLHLYGRDSVWGSLRYQQTVVAQIRTGFRPKTAQHRGGQFPLVEPAVTLELFKKTAPEYSYQVLPFSAPVQISEEPEPNLFEVDSSSSSSSSSSSEDEPQPTKQSRAKQTTVPDDMAPEADEATMARYRKVTHAMIVDRSGTDTLPFHQDQFWRPACGVRMSRADSEFLSEWSPELSFCQHPGCKKAWASIGLF